MVDFARGHPNSSLLPSKETCSVLENLCRCQSSDVLGNALQYGNEEGNKDFLEELRQFLERHTCNDDFGELTMKRDGASIDDDAQSKNHLFVTGGVSHGLELLCATQTQQDDVVLVERPTYFLVGGIFQCHGLVVRGLPMKDESTGGVNVDELVELVETGAMATPRMIYIIPTHQNPTGHSMCIEDRIKLASFASRHGVLVISDEVYHLLDWRETEVDGPRPAGMASLSALLPVEDPDSSSPSSGCVSVSSFTKIFAPGLRLGWIEGAKSIVDSITNYGYIRSQGGCAPLIGEIMRTALQSRVADDVLNKLRMEYKIRAETLCTILESEPQIQVVNRPIGGYFVWIKFPDSVNTEKFLEFCNRRIKFMLGIRCDIAVNNDTRVDARKKENQMFSCHARLCFADLDVNILERGLTELIACFGEYTDTLESRRDESLMN